MIPRRRRRRTMGMLVYGGSIAGLPLTFCFDQQSTTPIAVEGSPGLHDGGYMLATCSVDPTPACPAGHYSSADPGTACSAAWKPTFEWVPSQNGLFVDAPQRHSATVRCLPTRAGSVLPPRLPDRPLASSYAPRPARRCRRTSRCSTDT